MNKKTSSRIKANAKMEKPVRGTIRLLGCCLMIPYLSVTNVLADTVDDLFSLSLEELSEISISIATGNPKAITDAPAGTTLITADDIYVMGAQTLEEALQRVPGLYISRASINNAPRYFFRGVASRYNPQALLLVNGVPMRGLFLGDRSQHLPNQYSMPVKFIDRIEIIRGPGSALYGADAFAGVINVITIGPDSLYDTEAHLSGGSFDTARASLKQPLQAGSAKGALLLSYQTTNGDRDAMVSSDLQTNIDNLMLAPPASEAPGPTETSLKTYEIRLDVGWEKFRFRAGTTRSWDVGTGTGISDALDSSGKFVEEQDNLDITWTEKDWLPDVQLQARLSYLHNHFRSSPFTQLFPPGAVLGAFPDGVWSAYSVAEENAEASLIGTYTGLNDHRLTMGTGYFWGDMYKTTGYNNSQVVNGQLIPRPTFVETADTDDVFIPEEQRTNYYVFLQDEWKLAPSWELTTGIRFDDYDDVGSAVNPRIALVWNTSANLTSKLMYSEAFRVPSFSELWITRNPTGLGNPDLEPEKLRSTELIFIWQPETRITTTFNLYHFHIQDYIDFVPNNNNGTARAENIGRIEGTGTELELRYLISPRWSLLTNYSYQQTEDASTHQDLGLAPTQMGYLQLNWTPANWIVSPQLTIIGERLRQAGDSRPPLDGYTAFDLSIRRHWESGFSLGLITRNLFNANIREPSPGPGVNASQPSFVDDIPQQGRSFTLELNLEL